MATLNLNTAKREVETIGQYGNVQRVRYTWTGDAAQDDVVIMGPIPGNSDIDKVKVINGAFGASVTVDVGYQKQDATGSLTDDPDAFFDAQAAATAGVNVYDGAAVTVTEDVWLTVLFEGANPASETITVIVDYIHTR